jgi:hypothetical protein
MLLRKGTFNVKHLCPTCTASALSGSCTDRIHRNRGNIDGYKTAGESVVACPEYTEAKKIPHGWLKLKDGRMARPAGLIEINPVMFFDN